jgi:hypothetical protein
MAGVWKDPDYGLEYCTYILTKDGREIAHCIMQPGHNPDNHVFESRDDDSKYKLVKK